MNSRLNEIKDWPARAEARGFNVAAVAKDCGTGPRQLERFIRLHTGETPKKWFNSIRLQKAVSLDEAAAKKANGPPSPTYHYHLGMALSSRGDKAGARRELGTALQLAEKTPFPYADDARKALGTL